MGETKVLTQINETFMSPEWVERAKLNVRNSILAERVSRIADYCADGTTYSTSLYTDYGEISYYSNKNSDPVEYEYMRINGSYVLKSRTSRNSPDGTLYFAYDQYGNKIAEFDTSTGVCTQFVYDKKHTKSVIKSVRYSPGRSPMFENIIIDEFGRPTSSQGKNITRDYTYDDENLTVRTVVRKTNKGSVGISSDITCKYDWCGRLIMKTDNLHHRVTEYQYIDGLAIQESQIVYNLKVNGGSSKHLTYDVRITGRYSEDPDDDVGLESTEE